MRRSTGRSISLQTYKAQIPSLFRTNAVLVISDGIAARIGSLTADRERFMPWRTVTGDGIAPRGTPELETVLKGVFERRRFLETVKDFIVFGDTGSDVIKILAGYHQFHAVERAVAHVGARRLLRQRFMTTAVYGMKAIRKAVVIASWCHLAHPRFG